MRNFSKDWTPTSLSRRNFLQGTSLLVLCGGASTGSIARNVRHPAHSPLFKGRWPLRPLLKADLGQLLDTKNRLKTVHDRLVIDDMEIDGGWAASEVVSLGYTTERARSGTRSLRFSTLLRNEDYIRKSRRPNGSFTPSGVLFEGQPFAAFALRDATGLASL